MEVSREEKLEQLERVLHSQTLHNADSLRGFLRFAAEKVIDSQESQLKEYVIATEAFGRHEGFDPRIDSTVRVQASRLRTKLAEYYATEGKADRILIDLPKGQYTPVFSLAEKVEEHSIPETNSPDTKSVTNQAAVPVGNTPQEVISPKPDLESSAQIQPYQLPGSRKIQRPAALVFALTSLILGAMVFDYRTKNQELAARQEDGKPKNSYLIDRREISPLWGDFLNSSEPLLIVYSNTLFHGKETTGMKELKSLDSPGSSLGSPFIPQSEVVQSKEPVIDHYTGVGEVMGGYFLGDFLARVHHPSRVKRSLLLTWEDLKTENIVVLGSPAQNLFLRDLPQKQDLIFKQMPGENNKPDFGVLVNNPKAGEQLSYFAKQDGPSRSQITEDYAVVSLLQGVTGKKRLLILAGITTYGTQAAAEYVSKPEYINDLITHLNIAPAGAPPKLPMNFQVLIRVKVNGGVPVQSSYVTHHTLGQ